MHKVERGHQERHNSTIAAKRCRCVRREVAGATQIASVLQAAGFRSEIRAFQTAVDAFDEAVADRLGIHRTDLRCLDLLERHEAMTAGELAKASGLTTGAVTRLLDRVERMGYARRVRDSADRRRVLVELTPLARERAAEFYGPIAQAGQTGLERYSADQLTLLRDFLRGARAFHEQRTNPAQGAAEGTESLRSSAAARPLLLSSASADTTPASLRQKTREPRRRRTQSAAAS